MDAMPRYVSNARKGGPAGEIVVRESLQAALCELGWRVHTASSDAEAWGLVDKCLAPGEAATASGSSGRGQSSAEGPAGGVPCPSVVIVDEWTALDSRHGVRTSLVRHAKAGRVFVLSFFGRPLPQALVQDVGAGNVLTTYQQPVSGTGRDLGFTPLGFALDRTGGTAAEEEEAAAEALRMAEAVGSCRVGGTAAVEWARKTSERYRSAAQRERDAAAAAHGGALPLRPDPVPAMLGQSGQRCAAYGVLWGKQDDYVRPQMGAVKAALGAFADGAALGSEWGGGVKELALMDDAGAVARWLENPSGADTGARPSGGAQLDGRLCLITTAHGPDGSKSTLPPVAGLIGVGRIKPHEWHAVLEGACFLLGMGRPLAGPSAFEAMARGGLFINPIFPPPARRLAARGSKQAFESSLDLVGFGSQHPGAAATLPEPNDPPGLSRACNVSMLDDGRLDVPSTLRCIRRALLHGRCQVDTRAAAGDLSGAPIGADAAPGTGSRFSGNGPAVWLRREALRERARALFRPSWE